MSKGNNTLLLAALAAGAAYYVTRQAAVTPAAGLEPAPTITPEATGGFWSAIASNLTPGASVYPTGTVISSTGVPVIPTSAGDYAAATGSSLTPAPLAPVTPAASSGIVLPPGYILNAKGQVIRAPKKPAGVAKVTAAAAKAGYYFDVARV